VQYAKRIKDLALFFQGEKQKILVNLEKDMHAAAKELRFEEAGEIKKTIQALTHIHDVSLIKKENEFGSIRTAGPVRVEAYDIAHMSGQNMVGTMVVLEDGEFNNREYKVFNIQSVTASNDTAALEEVLVRRFAHKEWDYPQTVVIDGGIAQLRVAKKVLDNIKGAEKIEIVSVVKDDGHKAREILRIRGVRAGKSNLEGPILEEAAIKINAECHRFSIKTHRNKRAKKFLPGK
jgi:excinuclease ABC subunit C